MKDLSQRIYVLALSLSLALHVFNGGGDGLKPFHVTALIACFLSFKIAPRRGKLFNYTSLFVVLSLVSAILSFASSTLSTWLTYFIVIYGCYGLAYVDIDKILSWMIYLIPIDVLVLVRYAIVEPEFRFKAYYSDPNYMCTTLLCFLFLCIIIFMKRNNQRLVKYLMVIMIVAILALIVLTVSRTGIFCAVLMVLAVSFSALKKHFFKFVMIVFIGIFAVQHYASDFVDAQWGVLYDRVFDSNDNMENASNTRTVASMQNIYFILDNPEYLLFGLGPGTTHPDKAVQIPGLMRYRSKDIIDHNSWTSFFSEQGLLAMLCVLCIVFITSRAVFKTPLNTSKYLRCAFFLSIILFSLSISQKTYLPFWWSLFLLNNKQLNSI